MTEWPTSTKVYTGFGCTSSYREFGDRVNSFNTIAADAGLSCGASQILPCVHLAPHLGLKFVTNSSTCNSRLSFCGNYTHPLPSDLAHIVKFPAPLENQLSLLKRQALRRHDVCWGLTLRRLMSYIYIYIWSTHSWCF